MRIKKTSQYLEGGATLSNEYGTSQTDGYVQEYINSLPYVRSFNIESTTWTYNQNVKFYTLPYTAGIHSYIITGVVSYAPTALYSNVMLLVTQTGTNVRIDKLVGSNTFSAQGVDLYVTNTQAQSTLHLYGVCYVLR